MLWSIASPGDPQMDRIQEFISRYQREYDFYERAAGRVAQQLQAALESAGVRCIVTSRAKSPRALEAKLRQRATSKNYESLEAISADIIDLAGVRVALYFPGERDHVGSIIERTFATLRPPKPFPEDDAPRRGKRFSGYSATHYLVRLRDSSIPDAERRLTEAPVEIQVASVLMQAWAEVEHDLLYKPLRGELSQEEYATLDELNGLVLFGEIALERLQRAGEARVSAENRPFANHFEVAAYVARRIADTRSASLKDSDIGRIDLLFAFLDRCRVNTPALLAPYIDAVDSNFEQRPIAEQIIDQLLAEESSRYSIYEAVRDEAHAGLDVPDNYYDSEMGRFIRQWIVLEKLIMSVVERLNPSRPSRSLAQNIRVLEKSGLVDENLGYEIERIRRMRNSIVHGVEPPSLIDLVESTRIVAALVKQLENHLR
jgi:ppGpp synthetase/RelA/SpoT-type nucleotidyltranferase